MRYIRDIINDKKQGSDGPSEPIAHPRRASANSSPLILNEPIFPEDREEVVERKLASPEQAAAVRTIQRKAAAVAPNSVPNLDQTSKAPATPSPVQSEIEQQLEDDATHFAVQEQTDPFDKIRHTPEQMRDRNSSVSPLRVNHDRKAFEEQSVVDEMPEPEQPEAVEETPSAPVKEEQLTPLVDALNPEKTQMPEPAAGRGSKVSARVKTRLLGFSAEAFADEDPIKSGAKASSDFPVGWLVVVSDTGRGKAFALRDGVSTVGRGTDQTVCLDIGDNSISRESHISIAFDAEQKKFYVGHGGKTNLVRLNNKPLLSTEELNSKDMIRLGETTLRFMAFCDDDFSWDDQKQQTAQSA